MPQVLSLLLASSFSLLVIAIRWLLCPLRSTCYCVSLRFRLLDIFIYCLPVFCIRERVSSPLYSQLLFHMHVSHFVLLRNVFRTLHSDPQFHNCRMLAQSVHAGRLADEAHFLFKDV